jgi:hypothetical protein
MTGFFSFIISIFFISASFANDPHYCNEKSGRCEDYYVAHQFKDFTTLTSDQRQLLDRAGIDYNTWITTHDGDAAAFLSITHVLENMELSLGRGSVPAIRMLEKVNRFEGDRIRVALNRIVFEKWKGAGARYQFLKPDGKYEGGRIRFYSHTWLGSSLHKGYDIQGVTHIWKVPRLQINYRYSDSEADIDLDGYTPLALGFIPNPRHLAYENSDPRQWFEKLVEWFGDPGFRVRPY